MLYFMSTVRKLYKPVRCLRINPILKCKHSFENQEVGRHLETDSQITTRGTVSKAISNFASCHILGEMSCTSRSLILFKNYVHSVMLGDRCNYNLGNHFRHTQQAAILY